MQLQMKDPEHDDPDTLGGEGSNENENDSAEEKREQARKKRQ